MNKKDKSNFSDYIKKEEKDEESRDGGTKTKIKDIVHNILVYNSVYIKKDFQGKKNLVLGIVLLLIGIYMKRILLTLGLLIIVVLIILAKSYERYNHIELTIEEKKRKKNVLEKKIARYKNIKKYGKPSEEELSEYNKIETKIRKISEEIERESIKLYDYKNLKK